MPYDEHPSSPQQQWNEKNDMAVTFVNRDYAMAYAKWGGGTIAYRSTMGMGSARVPKAIFTLGEINGKQNI